MHRANSTSSQFRRRWVARLALQTKLVVAFSMLLLAALATSVGFFVERGQATISGLMGEQARQISQVLSFAAVQPYEDGDIEQLQRLGNDLIKSHNIVLVAFLDAEGKPLAVSSRVPELRRSAAATTPQLEYLTRVRRGHLASVGEYLQVTEPIIDRRIERASEPGRAAPVDRLRLHGYITVAIGQEIAKSELHRISVVSLGIGLIIFVLCLPLAMALIHRIFLPIRHLVTVTNRIAAGDYNTHVDMNRSDEIGQLARSFNDMADRIEEHRRQLEEKVSRRTSELEASNQRLSAEIAEKEDFLRAVSHDLNAPLRNISGMASLLLSKYRDRFDEEVAHRLERIRKNVENETSLISELLELSRIKTRRHRMEAISLDELVRDLADCFEPDLRERAITLTFDSVLPTLPCERMRLRQVFQNLIDNAIKYMGSAPVREIHIGHAATRDGYEFTVRDTGLGIHTEDLSKVFYVFRRGKNSAAANVAGKGIGLASVKCIIETYGGWIRVESQVGCGSTFRFFIPHPLPSAHYPESPGQEQKATRAA